jgi:quercetin dioxygenase-like cupin family protein
MNVTKAGQGKPYEAAKHYNCWGAQYVSPAMGSKALTVNVSTFLPNGGAEMGAGPERAYYVLSGSITVRGKSEEHALNVGDAIHIGPGEEREITVNGQENATLLVVIVTPS